MWHDKYNYSGDNFFIVDIEVIADYFPIGGFNCNTGKYHKLVEDGEIVEFLQFCLQYKPFLVMVNSSGYDAIILDAIISRQQSRNLISVAKQVNNFIFGKSIDEDDSQRKWIRKSLNIHHHIVHFDMLEFTKLSLKEMQCTFGWNTLESMQSAGIDLNATTLTDEQKAIIDKYLFNDVMSTHFSWVSNDFMGGSLYEWFDGKRLLIEEAGGDVALWSKSNSSIIGNMLSTTKKAVNEDSNYKYKCPIQLEFKHPLLQEVYDDIHNFKIDFSDKERIKFKKSIVIDGTEYVIAEGGLHGAYPKYKSSVRHIDFDFDSYYPSLLINHKFYPNNFKIDEYIDMKAKRVEYKKSADIEKQKFAKVAKIKLNGTYGKLGEEYSPIRSYSSMLNICFTGQIYLLKLVDILLDRGFKVIYANTDGITVVEDGREEELNSIFAEYSQFVNIGCETNVYKGVYLRDVNNYIIITDSDKLKNKGAFVCDSSKRNGGYHRVCYESIINYFKTGQSVDEYINNETNISKFTMYNKSNKGLTVQTNTGIKLPNVYRWVIGKHWHDVMIEKGDENGSKKLSVIADSKNFMDATELDKISINDIDKRFYINKAKLILLEVFEQYNSNNSLSTFLDNRKWSGVFNSTNKLVSWEVE